MRIEFYLSSYSRETEPHETNLEGRQINILLERHVVELRNKSHELWPVSIKSGQGYIVFEQKTKRIFLYSFCSITLGL
jgi:hypothetical protein